MDLIIKMEFCLKIGFIFCILFHQICCSSIPNICNKIDVFYSIHHCLPDNNNNNNVPLMDNLQILNHPAPTKNIYILYDINPVEGFNLRRDVFIRLAVFIKKLRRRPSYEKAKLVLPPFQRLYHWKSSDIQQVQIFWNHFFDLDSMKRYTAVIDFWEYFNEIHQLTNTNKISIDHLFQLKNYDNFFDENGNFMDKFEVDPNDNAQQQIEPIFGYGNITANQIHSISYQGNVMKMYQLIESFRKPRHNQRHFSILIDRAEIVLHDHWGNVEFWRARRSMRFNANLVAVAQQYRELKFRSNDLSDGIQRPDDWRTEQSYRGAVGGNYLCAHLRRADFLYGREKTVPTLRSAAAQIKKAMRKLNLDNVFIASDCSTKEYKDLKSHLQRVRVHRFIPGSYAEKSMLKDGGIAIIDQIICSHARHFIGTYESTFTYRIYEEREILGFPMKTTFNTFCKNADSDNDSTNDNDNDCMKNSVWPIEY